MEKTRLRELGGSGRRKREVCEDKGGLQAIAVHRTQDKAACDASRKDFEPFVVSALGSKLLREKFLLKFERSGTLSREVAGTGIVATVAIANLSGCEVL